MSTNVIETLRERGFIEALTSEEICTLTKKPCTVYIGFDPTADSLHLGNMVPLMGLAWFQRFGHRPIAVVGGATGLIGDPSGKSHERPLLSSEQLQINLEGIQKNLECFLDFKHPSAPAKILNNNDWFQKFSYIDFLRDVGKHFRLGPMLSKESVKARLESPEGISYTEFSYQVVQGYDFYHLYKAENTKIQMGGSDQWGNITAGTELIRKLTGEAAFGITFPLLTTSDGKKFGKSEHGAIWLSPNKISPYEFYQYLFSVSDADVIKLMRMLTFMDMEEIHRYETQDLPPNTAQKRLAEEVTRLVHGEEGLKTALKVTAAAAPGSTTQLDIKTLETISKDMPYAEYAYKDLVNASLVDVLFQVNLTTSKGEARRLIRNGGVYLNNIQVQDENLLITPLEVIEGRLVLLSIGKKKKLLIRVSKEKNG